MNLASRIERLERSNTWLKRIVATLSGVLPPLED